MNVAYVLQLPCLQLVLISLKERKLMGSLCGIKIINLLTIKDFLSHNSVQIAEC